MERVACRKQPRSKAAGPGDFMHEEAMEDERPQVVDEESGAMETTGKLYRMLGVSLSQIEIRNEPVTTFICIPLSCIPILFVGC